MAKYIIINNSAREKRGMKSWGVFEIQSPSFRRCVSEHWTEKEAIEAKLALEAKSEGQP